MAPDLVPSDNESSKQRRFGRPDRGAQPLSAPLLPPEQEHVVTITPPAIIALAVVETETPDRHAEQLVAHLGRNLTFVVTDGIASAPIGGGVGSISAGNGVLTLVATAPDRESLGVIEHVLGRHLERVGQRDGLVVSWTEAIG